MENKDFTTTLLVEQTPEEVFNAICNVRGWWSEEITGGTEKLNDEFNYHYEDVHLCKIKLTEVVPHKKIVWLVTDNYFNFTKDKREWKDNKIIFEITKKGNKTQLQFTQLGLVPEYECYDICQGAWTTYIQKSLRSLIVTGKGQPNGKENLGQAQGKRQTADEKEPTANFTSTFFVTQTPEEVFNAINNVSAWWQGEIKGNSKKLDDVFEYKMLDIHYSKQRLIEIIPYEKIVWLVTDSNLSSFKNKSEWNGTKIIFEIKEINGKTQLRFTHIGLVPEFQCYGDCSGAWEMLFQQSLFSLITTGKGKKVF